MSKSADTEGIYLRLPIILQNLITNFHGWRIKATRFNPDFDRILRETEKRGAASPSVRRAYRDEALHKFIVHAAQSVPYYQRLFAEWGLNPNDMRSLTDLQRLPSLDKATVQANMSDLISRSVPLRKQVMIHTSGTTGGGLRFPTTQQAVHAQWAIWWRYRHWHGLRQNTWCGYFGGRSIVPLSQTNPPFWRINYPGRQILFSAYHLSFATVSAYVAELNRRRPPWLHGYPSLLTLLASLMHEQNLSLDYRLEWVTVGAENLLQQQSNKMEQVFGVRPIQHYGMAEAVANISQYTDHGLYVDEDFSAVELIPNVDGGYKVFGTNFTNYAMPLIRYEVGDVVQLPDEDSEEDWGRQVIAIDGRQEDYIILNNGVRLGRMDHIFKDMVNIREAQIYQAEPGQITVRVVRNGTYTKLDEEQLLSEFQKRTGPFAEIKIVYVDELERTSTGKLRFVISDITEGKLVQT